MKRGAYTRKWDIEARRFRKQNPLCAMCARDGRYTLARVVDHIVPHKNNHAIMWDRTNWQSLCIDCHNRSKKQIETRGYRNEVDRNGYPIDPNHPSNAWGHGGKVHAAGG